MSIKRIDEFPEGDGSLSNDDIFLFMDDPSGSSTTKKISLNAIAQAIGISGSGSNPSPPTPFQKVGNKNIKFKVGAKTPKIYKGRILIYDGV